MAARVIDYLEVIQIYEQNRAIEATSLAHRQRLCQSVQQQAPIRQLGKRVKIRQLNQLRLSRLAGCNVEKAADVMGYSTDTIHHRCDAEPLNEFSTIFALVPDFSLPSAIFFD